MGQTDIEGSGIIEQILIDFRGGAHGNFLEFLLNTLYYRADWQDPFTIYGTSHMKPYNNLETKFYANHFTQIDYSFRNKNALDRNKDVILITYNPEDLLMLSSISFLRSSDYNLRNEHLEIDTYNKLDNDVYREVLKNIIQSYSLTECTKVNSNISRHILREMFKFGFKTPKINGFMIALVNSKSVLANKNVYEFPLSAFYNINLLKNQLTSLAKYYKLDLLIDELKLERLHQKFMSKIEYLDNKHQCDDIVTAIVEKRIIVIPNLTLFQESYINAQLENIFKIEMPFLQNNYFSSTKEILEWIQQKK